MFTKEEIALAPKVIEAIKKISKGKWEWEPEVGEWCIWQNKLYVIYEVEENVGYVIDMKDIRIAAPYDFHYVMRKSLIPLLHWERIERMLEGMGYVIELDIQYHYSHKRRPFAIDETVWNNCREYKGSRVIACCKIYSSDRMAKTRFVLHTFGKTRQEAVMRSVITLGKEIKSEKM